MFSMRLKRLIVAVMGLAAFGFASPTIALDNFPVEVKIDGNHFCADFINQNFVGIFQKPVQDETIFHQGQFCDGTSTECSTSVDCGGDACVNMELAKIRVEVTEQARKQPTVVIWESEPVPDSEGGDDKRELVVAVLAKGDDTIQQFPMSEAGGVSSGEVDLDGDGISSLEFCVAGPPPGLPACPSAALETALGDVSVMGGRCTKGFADAGKECTDDAECLGDCGPSKYAVVFDVFSSDNGTPNCLPAGITKKACVDGGPDVQNTCQTGGAFGGSTNVNTHRQSGSCCQQVCSGGGGTRSCDLVCIDFFDC